MHQTPDTPELAALFKAAGDPLRLNILRILARDTFSVAELCTIFDMRQSSMSHHLKVLANAGLVEPQREGNTIFYRRPPLPEDDTYTAAREAVYSLVDTLPVQAEVRAAIDLIKQHRAQQSQVFFARYGGHLQAHQELIADYSLYAEPTAELLDRLKSPAHRTVLEIGPGEGRFLSELSGRFDQVWALDTSSEMLEKCQAWIEQEQLGNCTLIEGDTREALRRGLSVDVIVMNMVLHHVPAPHELFEDCARLLRPGGLLILCDLCRHQQAWAREACGDLWLGFDADDLTRWAEAAGLTEGETLLIGVRNGFQIQIRHFDQPATGASVQPAQPAFTLVSNATK
ncbi:metalloregulator ArsR/SmtB family transcription factor [Hahella sp. SMD15-11]|uniref:Metalloregulator ArsR/SmtB family transcription factor n=1 Tax=Thermohahella caldifontis TaxID=3142973 RepID=A0AB39UVJ1_9GAMM